MKTLNKPITKNNINISTTRHENYWDTH